MIPTPIGACCSWRRRGCSWESGWAPLLHRIRSRELSADTGPAVPPDPHWHGSDGSPDGGALSPRWRARLVFDYSLQHPFNSHQVSVWVSVRRCTAAPRRLQPSLNPHVSASRDAPERAKAELESERPARDRGFESPHFRSADDIGPRPGEGGERAPWLSGRWSAAGHGSCGSAFDCPAKTSDWAGGAKIS